MAKLFAAVLLSAFLTIHPGNSQGHDYIASDLSNSTVLGVYNVGDEIIIIVSNGLNLPIDVNQNFAIIFYRMQIFGDNSGFDLVEINRIQMEEGYQVFSSEYIQSTQEWIFAMANNVLDPSGRSIRIQVYSSSLFLKEEMEMNISGFPEKFYIDTYKDKTSILGWVSPPPGDKLMYIEYIHHQTEGLQPFFVGQSEPDGMFWITSMCFDDSTGNMLVFHYNGIAILDSTLYKQKDYTSIDGILTSEHGEVIRVGNNYYSHGAIDTSWNDGRRKLILNKYDTSFVILKSDVHGWPDHDNYPFMFNSIEYQDSILLIGGNLDGPFNGIDFFDRYKKFYLAKYDLEVNEIWYKEYGGDRAYSLFGLELLESGSSIAYGFVTDTFSDFRYAYIMYVNENGEIVSSKEIPVSDGLPLRVVNPGSDQITILNPDGLDARIVLTTMDGKVVLNNKLSSDLTNFDLSTLPTGMYPYVFYLDDKPVKSGKWVKKE